jgi:hypothetical protein
VASGRLSSTRRKLHFSRLSQLATRSIDEIGRVCANDSAKIFQYLVAQRQLPRGSALRTVILAEASQIPALQGYCQSGPEIQFEYADLGAEARKLKLKDLPGDSNAEKLLIHCLASKPPADQFAPATDTRFHRLWRIRSALVSAGWLVFAACLLFAGKTGLRVAELRDQSELTRLATAEDTRRYNAILDGLPKVSLTPDNLRALTAATMPCKSACRAWSLCWCISVWRSTNTRASNSDVCPGAWRTGRMRLPMRPRVPARPH